jgi:hypothetical protein
MKALFMADQPADEPADELEGLTAVDCCESCSPEKCSITKIGVCGHPQKGGLHAISMQDPAVLRKFNQARKLLALERTAQHQKAVSQSTEGVRND